jgi:hypothetical protein
VAFGCGSSKKVGDVVGEANVEAARSWACSFTSRRSSEVGDGVGYCRSWPWKSIALAPQGVWEARERKERGSSVADDGNLLLFFLGFGGSPASSRGLGMAREMVAGCV